MQRILMGFAGIAVILALAVLLSSNRRAIRLRVVAAAFALQAGIAVLVLYTSWGKAGIQGMAGGVSNLLGYANKGTEFLFGPAAANPLAHTFALGALPVIIFFASIVAILYHLGVMQRIVRWVGGAIGWITGIGRVESLSAAANIFVGQSESPLVVRPYLAALPPSQLFTVMTVGMAGVAGTILLAYAQLLGERALPFLLAAAFMSAPGGILMAKIIMPDEPRPKDPCGDELPLGDAAEEKIEIAETFEEGERPANIIMAAAQGAQTGVKLAVAVGAMVLAFVALVALANGLLGGLGNMVGITDLSFQRIVGTIFRPIMFLIGVPWKEAGTAGGLFGTKIVLNEFVAFINLGQMNAGQLSARSVAIVTFALCGFANFSSIAIQMAVTGGLAPNQRPVIARLGLKALAAGSLANLMSAALAGLLLPL
jgi:CNT family concentrative nucleoside transporter